HVWGGTASYSVPLAFLGEEGLLRTGMQVREDLIDPVGLYDTTGRIRWKTVSVTRAQVASIGTYAAWQWRPAAWWRLELGARFDSGHFDVRADLPANSGTASASLVSPKLTMAFGPWARSELFLDFGQGFHSNDARGTTITIDPNDPDTAVSKVTPLVRATGAEVGVRSTPSPELELTAAL